MTPRHTAQLLERQHTIGAPHGVEMMAGFGLLGVSFESGHVLALRRFTASSIGPPYSAVWLRDPQLRWTIFTNVEPTRSCPRYFGPALHDVCQDDIEIAWRGHGQLAVSLRHAHIRFALRLAATPLTTALDIASRIAPRTLWEREHAHPLIGPAAGSLLRAGRLTLAGRSPSGHRFLVRPRRIWRVDAAACISRGADLGPIVHPDQQAHLGEFLIPSRPLFAAGVARFRTP